MQQEALPVQAPSRPQSAAAAAPDSNGSSAAQPASAAAPGSGPDRQPSRAPPPGPQRSGLGRFFSKIGLAGESVAPEVRSPNTPATSQLHATCLQGHTLADLFGVSPVRSLPCIGPLLEAGFVPAFLLAHLLLLPRVGPAVGQAQQVQSPCVEHACVKADLYFQVNLCV